MRTSRLLTLALGLFGTAFWTANCGGTQVNAQGDGGGDASKADAAKGCATVPTNHRPSSIACSATRPPGINDAGASAPYDGGGGSGARCTSDSDCTSGKNPRCTPPENNGVPTCESDECSSDTDCGKGAICECGTSTSPGRYPNVCLPGNCQVDSDCGCGYCSPSDGTSCGAYGGVVGYYCHVAQDECTNDDECTDAGNGYCAFQPTTNRWSCFYSFCAG
jgi:hypothetical protein